MNCLTKIISFSLSLSFRSTRANGKLISGRYKLYSHFDGVTEVDVSSACFSEIDYHSFIGISWINLIYLNVAVFK